jgi:hypothetical protein
VKTTLSVKLGKTKMLLGGSTDIVTTLTSKYPDPVTGFVLLEYSADLNVWVEVATVAVGSSSGKTVLNQGWQPPVKGKYKIRATYLLGDSHYAGSTRTATLVVS